MQSVIVNGDEYMEYIEMGGRDARDQLRMKLPEFAAAPKPVVRRTDSLLEEVLPYRILEYARQWRLHG